MALCADHHWRNDGALALTRLAGPGIRLGVVPAGIGAVVIAMWLFSAVKLLAAPAQDRAHLLLGTTAAVCPFLITLVAAPLFVAFGRALRGFAPKQLRSAGAALGFAAVVATFKGNPTDITHRSGLAAVVDGEGTVSHVSIFAVNDHGHFTIKGLATIGTAATNGRPGCST